MAHSSRAHPLTSSTNSSSSSNDLSLHQGLLAKRPYSTEKLELSKEKLGMGTSLPDTAQTLLIILDDHETLLQLLKTFGGNTLSIPSRWPSLRKNKNHDKHPLLNVLNQGQMIKIVKHYGGTELYIPKCHKYISYTRNMNIVNSFSTATRNGISSGKAVQKLAKLHQLSDRRIWGILKNTTHKQD